MTLGFSLDLRDQVSALLSRYASALAGAQLNAVLARAAVNAVRDHFTRLEADRPNKLGGTRTHFWAQCARATHSSVLPDGFVIGVNQVGIRQRLEGGTIRPKNGKFLTIPESPEAHGKRAREFNNLRFDIVEGLGPALVKALNTEITWGRKRKDGSRQMGFGEVRGGEVMYRLARQVTQQADSTVIPSENALRAVVAEAGDSYLKRLAERGDSSG